LNLAAREHAPPPETRQWDGTQTPLPFFPSPPPAQQGNSSRCRRRTIETTAARALQPPFLLFFFLFFVNTADKLVQRRVAPPMTTVNDQSVFLLLFSFFFSLLSVSEDRKERITIPARFFRQRIEISDEERTLSLPFSFSPSHSKRMQELRGSEVKMYPAPGHPQISSPLFSFCALDEASNPTGRVCVG